MSKYRRVRYFWVADHQVATVAMETTQLVLSQFKNFFTYFTNWIVMANSTNTFKHRLDIYWQDQEITYDFRAQLQGTGSRSNILRFD